MHPLLIQTPFPTIDAEGELHDGFLLQQEEFCRVQCEGRPCRDFHTAQGGIAYHTCPHGFTVACANLNKIEIRVNGVVETTSNESPPIFKKKYKSRKLKAPQFEAWIDSLKQSRTAFENQVKAEAVDSIHALHDIKAIIATLLSTTEDWVFRHPGANTDQMLDSSPPELVTIYHSCRVLESLLRMTDIIANPSAASYGQKRGTTVYSVFHLLTKVFTAKADARKVQLELRGPSFNRPQLYGSFILVPLVLIDNAIKHSERGKSIHINVKDNGPAGVIGSVSSIGYLIPMAERHDIFTRGERGSNTEAGGSGLGLYVASTVAAANNFSIEYSAEPYPGSVNYGYNIFTFKVN